MEHPLTVWVGVAVYAALGLFGIVVFHGSAPKTQDLTAGYGVAYSALAGSAANSAIRR